MRIQNYTSMKTKIPSLILAVIGCCMFTACDEPSVDIKPEQLNQTTWNVHTEYVDTSGQVYNMYDFIIQFTSTSEGIVIAQHDDYSGKVTYSTDGIRVTFNGAITGVWFLLRNVKDEIKLYRNEDSKTLYMTWKKYKQSIQS